MVYSMRRVLAKLHVGPATLGMQQTLYIYIYTLDLLGNWLQLVIYMTLTAVWVTRHDTSMHVWRSICKIKPLDARILAWTIYTRVQLLRASATDCSTITVIILEYRIQTTKLSYSTTVLYVQGKSCRSNCPVCWAVSDWWKWLGRSK